MFGKDITEKKRTRAAALVSVLYVISAAVYFLPYDIPYKIAFPTVAIAVASLWLLPWQMSLALVASALGDIRGAAGSMIGQIEFFSIAHLFLILFFVHRWFHEGDAFERAGGRHPETRAAVLAVYAVLSVCALAFAMVRIIPEAPEGMVRGCTALYAVIICMMLFCALAQRSRSYAFAAVLFVFSDAMIGWNAFVGEVPGEKYLIMLPYYVAQLTFFLRAAHFGLRRQ